MSANVWTVDTAVDELMRLRRVIERLGAREDELRALVEEIRRRGQSTSHGFVAAQLKWAADKLNVRLLPPEVFEPKEPGQ